MNKRNNVKTAGIAAVAAFLLAGCGGSTTTADPTATVAKPRACTSLVGHKVTSKVHCDDGFGGTALAPGQAGCILYISTSPKTIYGKLGGKWRSMPSKSFSITTAGSVLGC